MNDSDQTKLFIEISSKLASIDTKMSTLCSTLATHEQRISQLEHSKSNSSDDFKTELLKLLAKSTCIGLVIIGSLTGSAGIISKVLGI